MIGVYPVLRRSDTASLSRFEELEPRIVVLQHLGLLQASSRPVLERLAADISELGISAGTTIIREHDVADAFYVVRAGVNSRCSSGIGTSTTCTLAIGSGRSACLRACREPRP